MLTYEEIDEFYRKHEKKMSVVANGIEIELARKRDSDNRKYTPIYVTRTRVKNPDSLYLKTKMKGDRNSILEYTDLIGIRVLTLFENLILELFKQVINVIISTTENEIQEIQVYGMKDDNFRKYIDSANLKINKFPPSAKKDSGYKSIHIIALYQGIDNVKYPVEFQLRTLLQDVWGELEHKMSYKQKDKTSFIKDGFELLGRNLDTNDFLLSKLLNSLDSDVCNVKKLRFRAGTNFGYDENNFPKVLITESKYKDRYEAYSSSVSILLKEYDEKQYQIAKDSFFDLKKDLIKEQNVDYWLDMEEVLLDSFNINDDSLIDNLEHKYKYIISKYKDKFYVPYFRIAQIYNVKEDYISALRNFDKSKEIVNNFSETESTIINKIKISLNIALIYWLLGKDFIDASYKEIEYTIDIVKKHLSTINIPPLILHALYNGGNWYSLELFNKKKKSDEFKKYKDILIEYHELNIKYVEFLEEKEKSFELVDVINANAYDTIAYTYKILYEQDNQICNLEKAMVWVEKLRKNLLKSVTMYYSPAELHSEHIKEIECLYFKVKS